MDKIQTSRSPTGDEYSNLLKFLDQHLRPQNEWSISAEYPTALVRENIHNLRIISDGEKVLSHAALKPHIVKTPQAIFKVGAIGSVVTHNDHRNQGLSRLVLNDCLDLAAKQDCDFAILWTDLHDFYNKIGFALSGFEVRLLIKPDFQVALDKQFKFLKTPQVDPAALSKLMSQHTVSTLRSPEDIRKFLNIPNSNVYTLWEPNGTLSAFAVEGKGADLSGYIHEWGGNVSGLLQLFKYIQTDQKKDISVIVPGHSENLIEQAIALGSQRSDGFLGMIKLINEENFFKKIHRYAKQDLGISNLILDKKDGEYRIGTTEQYLCTPTPTDIIPLIFGPTRFSMIDGFGKPTVDVLESIFPLQFWLWGWDSV